MHNYTALYTVITNNGLNTMAKSFNHLISSVRLQAGVLQQHMWCEYIAIWV